MISKIFLNTTANYLEHYYNTFIAIQEMVNAMKDEGMTEDDMQDLPSIEERKQEVKKGLEEAINANVTETEKITLDDLRYFLGEVNKSDFSDSEHLLTLERKYNGIRYKPRVIKQIKTDSGIKVPEDLLEGLAKDYYNPNLIEHKIEAAINDTSYFTDVTPQTVAEAKKQGFNTLVERTYNTLKQGRLNASLTHNRTRLAVGVTLSIIDREELGLELLRYGDKLLEQRQRNLSLPQIKPLHIINGRNETIPY